MKLLEYQVDKFYKDCIYNDVKKHECASKGYNLAYWIEKEMEHWLDSKDCTVEEFIQAVCDYNIKNSKVSETELFEILARFLCGYDAYEKFKDPDLDDIDSKISNQDLLDKLDEIRDCLD